MRRIVALGLLLGLAGCGSDASTPAAPAPPALASVTPTAAPPPPPTTPASNDQPPLLVLKVAPEPTIGTHPFTITVNMCRSSDPENDRLVFTFKFGDSEHHYASYCRLEHTYAKAGRYKTLFCVNDRPTEPTRAVCQHFIIPVD
jgi:hypothetical protein